MYNATKFGINQIMLSVVFASMSGINRLNKIARFTEDGLVRSILLVRHSIRYAHKMVTQSLYPSLNPVREVWLRQTLLTHTTPCETSQDKP